MQSIAGYQSMQYRFKLLYEFWGFCVNGGSSLELPGGFAATTPFNLPSGFESGSLLLSGSDGSTSLGTQFFSSSLTSFTSDHVGKHLVTWISGSESTDDSIYKITSFINSGTIRVNTQDGGTPLQSANDEPYFTDRSNVNFRIIDFIDSMTNSPIVSGSYMVFQFDGSSDINDGQQLSQCKITHNYITTSNNNFTFHLSPSGSWTGSSFSDLSSDYSFINPYNGTTSWQTTGTGIGSMTIIADKSFMFHHSNGSHSTAPINVWAQNGSSGWFIEVPDRVYPKENDPNLLLAIVWVAGLYPRDARLGFSSPLMIDRDGSHKLGETLARSYAGYVFDARIYQSSNITIVKAGEESSAFNVSDNNLLMSEALVAFYDEENYEFSRCRFRNLRILPNLIPDFHLIGTDVGNSWIKLGDYMVVPWDSAKLNKPFVLEF